MIKTPKAIYTAIFLSLLLCASINLAYTAKDAQPENHPPVVKIINPKNNSTFNWDTPVNYEITVSDKEDGDTKFDEINAKEVLLEVTYISTKTKAGQLPNTMQNDPPGMATIRTSNCFNCHDFKGKSIGPSFYEIAKRYPATTKNVDSLAKHIRNGSSGTWGKEKMPTHAELTSAEIKSAVQWLLKNSTTPDVSYYTGIAGVVRIKKPTAPSKTGGMWLLIASYTDHGLKNTPGQRLKGQDVVTIQPVK